MDDLGVDNEMDQGFLKGRRVRWEDVKINVF